ncbi:MAG TPA: choice-of-anchor Q domain-containing protein [Actinomycetota bacterium]
MMCRGFLSVICLGTLVAVTGPASSAIASASLTVDTFADTFDGSCADADCSLRDAVASVDPGGTVRVPPGFYALDRSGTGPYAGDVDLSRPVTIVGTGETGSFVDASALGDRVFDVSSDVSLRHLALLGGSPVGRGGVVRTTAGTLVVSRCTIVRGRADNGGAVAVGNAATASIDRSWISDNRATARGGGLFLLGATVVSRSTVSGNRAAGGGGAFVGPGDPLTIGNATVSRNVAVRGGGVRAIGDIELSFASIVANRAGVGGGVLISSESENSTANSVFARNRASDRGPLCARPLTSDGRNVADVRGCGLRALDDLTGVDPRVGILRQNGGSTPTHALKADSPARGRGSGCDPTDQRGAPRSACDSGAYELVLCRGRPVTIVGTPGPDEFSGGLGRDVFLGRGGDDEFQGSLDVDRACGGKGDDHLIGGPGDDHLTGTAGRDLLLGEGGGDLLIGGPGVDVCRGGGGHDVTRRCETAS